MSTDNFPICAEGGKGLVFPAVPNEHEWPSAVRICLYAFGLIYFFLGVAIIADIFMDSIGKVTSLRVQKVDKGKPATRKFWNETVATLTLMALGSSAPEIFLSVIDIVKKEFHFGMLGPSTIVGSAAFNLQVIVAVCVVVIPSGELRVIEKRPAFYITALFSLGVYLWMAFILTVSTPSIVDWWEGVVTALLLPVLVFVSFKVDRGDADFLLRKVGLKSEDEVGEAPASFFRFTESLTKVLGSTSATTVDLRVERVGPCEDEATVEYNVEGMSAVAGLDFDGSEGTLVFGPRVKMQVVSVTVHPRPIWRRICQLVVVLSNPDGEDVGLDPEGDTVDDTTLHTVVLETLPESGGVLSHLDNVISLYGLHAAFVDWRDQIKNVCYCNGDYGEHKQASKSDLAMHFLALPWKVIFSFVPPTSFLGGWLTFYMSLATIAGITACVSDIAEIVGCLCSVPDIVTAITFVALGTSMPDLFASITAAKEEPTADASIVNVTGSNSVNVFLGLGVPWTIASFYWKLNGSTADWKNRYFDLKDKIDPENEGLAAFIVRSENLGFSVLTFSVVCCVTLCILHFRRTWLGGELGGPTGAKWSTFVVLVGYWVGWVAIVSWRVMIWTEQTSGAMTMGIMGAAGMGTFAAGCAIMLQMKFISRRQAAHDAKAAESLANAPREKENHHDVSLTGSNGIVCPDSVLMETTV